MAPADQEVAVTAGVTYRHLRRAAPDGQPWSIHVLEVDRRRKSVILRALEGHVENGEMQRELPTALAARSAQAGDDVLAAINGDYDLGNPPLGIPTGLSVTSGRLWTSARPGWPVMALERSGRPHIGIADVSLELDSQGLSWTIGAFNKPPASEELYPWPRLYTREYRATVKSAKAFRAAVIEQLKPALPLRVDHDVHGVVTKVYGHQRELAIPPNALVVVEPEAPTREGDAVPRGVKSFLAEDSAPMAPLTALRVGDKVKLRIRVRVAGQKVRDVVGGFPIIVEAGQRSIADTPSEHLRLRHPRTAACYNDRMIIFSVVDGRQPQVSVGMTLEELADLMVSLGCTVAINLDGGGSSVMAVALPATARAPAPPAPSVPSAAPAPSQPGAEPSKAEAAAPNLQSQTSGLQIVNSPSDGAERGRGNVWLLIRKH